MSADVSRLFTGRVLGVATMHGKERAIGPAFAERFDLADVRAIEGLDTDRFGAFSGEVERRLSARAAAEAKARAGAEHSGLDLVVASEGSFGPHPQVPFVHQDEEWLVLVDLSDGSVRAHRHVSLDAVWAGRACGDVDELLAFAAKLPFPEHRLVLRPREHPAPGERITKGIASRAELEREARELLARHGSLWVEVDLRAHANPTRMGVIAAAAREFAQELATPCPACGAPHFRVVAAVPGLPCSLCGAATRTTLALRRACDHCGHAVLEPRPDGRGTEDPAHCDVCNP